MSFLFILLCVWRVGQRNDSRTKEMTAIIMTSLLSTDSGVLFYPGKSIPIEEDVQTNSILPFPFCYSTECIVLIFKISTEI